MGKPDLVGRSGAPAMCPAETPLVLRLLADGAFHSGEELGEVLGVSRTAVWKQLRRLEVLGIPVESVKGVGYRIVGGLDLLDKAVIETGLRAEIRRQIVDLEIQSSPTSTNDIAMARARSGDSTGAVFLAEQQTAGRGRRGRNWVSPFGRNLYLSMVWGFEQGAAALDGLSLAVGVAVRRALLCHGIEEVGFKWPNDLLVGHKKLGGILLEITGDPSDFCQVVVGVGVNVAMPPDRAGAIDQEWIDLKACSGGAVGRNDLAISVIEELVSLLKDYATQGFSCCRDEWLAGDCCRDRVVTLLTPTRQWRGIARGVDAKGALLLESEGEIVAHLGGEISLRVEPMGGGGVNDP